MHKAHDKSGSTSRAVAHVRAERGLLALLLYSPLLIAGMQFLWSLR